MKKLVFIISAIFFFSWLEPANSFEQAPWHDIPIPGRKNKDKGKANIPENSRTEKKSRIYKDYKTRELEYKQFYSSFIINDGTINKEERIFLDLKKAELALSNDEVESIEFLVKLEIPAVIHKD